MTNFPKSRRFPIPALTKWAAPVTNAVFCVAVDIAGYTLFDCPNWQTYRKEIKPYLDGRNVRPTNVADLPCGFERLAVGLVATVKRACSIFRSIVTNILRDKEKDEREQEVSHRKWLGDGSLSPRLHSQGKDKSGQAPSLSRYWHQGRNGPWTIPDEQDLIWCTKNAAWWRPPQMTFYCITLICLVEVIRVVGPYMYKYLLYKMGTGWYC